jgi:biotin operon repressor
MKFSRHQAIREVLLESEDGMTIQEIADKLGCGYKSIQKTIKVIWGVYIDRWAVPKRGQFAAVYMCVEVPPHAPHPTERYLPKTMWQPHAPITL